MNNYKILQILGYGSFGKVFKMININTQAIVAVKKINRQRISDTDIGREITALQKVKTQSHQLQLIDVLIEHGFYNIVT